MVASSVLSIALVAGTEQQLVGPNPRRKRITFTAANTTGLNVRPDKAGDVTGGLQIAISGGSLIMDVDDYGDIVKGPWFGFISAGAVNVGIIDTVY